MTEQEIAELKKANNAEFLKMDRDAGNVISHLLYELQNQQPVVYIRLSNAELQGTTVYYEVVEGDPEEVLLWAETLNFSSWDAEKLEV